MKMTVEKIREILNQNAEKLAKARSEVEELAKKEAMLEEECKAAVAAVDSNTYYEKNVEKGKVSADLFVKRAFLEKLEKAGDPISLADACEAWNSYVSGYNAKLEKAMAAFKAKRDELNSMYKAMVDLQQQACETRELIAKASGKVDQIQTFKMNYLPNGHILPCNSGYSSDRGLIALDGFACNDPDAVYYLACYEQNHDVRFSAPGFDWSRPPEENERMRVQRVVLRQESH